MTWTISREIVRAQAYATTADFEQIFANEMSGLYLLSFLLAGDREKAEQLVHEWVPSTANRL